MSATAEARPQPGQIEQVATRVAFFVAGFLLSSWAPLIPLTRVRIGLNEAQLGGLLLCLGLGSVVSMPLSGGLVAKRGCRVLMLIATSFACIGLPIMATAGNSTILALSLLVCGAGIGSLDVVMNVQAVIVEKASGRAMMSGFHGMFSVGGIAGAGAVTAMLAVGLSPIASILSVVALTVCLIASMARGLLPYGGESDSPRFALPKGRVLLIGALCLIMFLAEGSVLDWSGVLLNVTHGLDKSRAGLGYVAFSIAMSVGRLTGDRFVDKVGPRITLLSGGLCAATGFAIAAVVPSWPVSVFGFILVGVGASNVVPVLFTAAGRQTAMPSGLAIAAITTMGYAGILLGPAVIGFVARATTLPVALLMVAAALVCVAFSAQAATSE